MKKFLLILVLFVTSFQAQSKDPLLPFIPTSMMRLFAGLNPMGCGGCEAYWTDSMTWFHSEEVVWGDYSVVENGGSGSCALNGQQQCVQVGSCTAWSSVTVNINSGYDLFVGSSHYSGPFQYQTSISPPGQFCGLFPQTFTGDVYMQGNPPVYLGRITVTVGCNPCQ